MMIILYFSILTFYIFQKYVNFIYVLKFHIFYFLILSCDYIFFIINFAYFSVIFSWWMLLEIYLSYWSSQGF